MEKKREGKILVVGMGNLIYRDEGIGVHIIREMEKMKLPSHIELLDIGTSTMDLISYMKEVKKLIVIDAMRAGGKPGTIYKCKPEDLLPKDEGPISLHEIGLLETLNMTKKLGMEIQTVIVGIEPEIMEWGTELTEAVKNKIPMIIEAVLKES
jgi:hydrogenase maturation protease